MRARLFGRWVGRAAVFAVLGFGALVAGGVASASAYIDNQQVESVGPTVTSSFQEGALQAFGFDWN
ncbi:hypothetical protein [Asanoa iriomotensis]|uniref:Uncharacterized protein n=1 Tax=Asanoa iriomotensis TaxID=234613 RepID=A0ABQ4BUR3_9ACTN|nr:hypothetical protein [Asanoa iriomotensis]GIF54271.1 hypothetical protein Air01nite_03660 [Asanoa iriomotensis]